MSPTPETLLNEINGPVRWHLLHYAVQVRIFDLLHDWTAAARIADQLNTDAQRTALYLDGLVACGYLHKFMARYRNTGMAERYLVSDGEQYQGRVFLALSRMRLQHLDRLQELLQPETHDLFRLADETVWAQAAAHLTDFQKAIAPHILARLHAMAHISECRDLIDLGGGPGYIGFTVLQVFTHMRGVLFDLPAVVEQARRLAEAMQLEPPRVRFRAGDYNRDSLGGGYDLVIAGRSLYYAHDIAALMRAIAASMNPKGILLCMHEGLYNERTAPPEVVLSRIGVALRGSDVSFERGELENAITGAGLRIEALHNLDALGGNTDLIVGVRP